MNKTRPRWKVYKRTLDDYPYVWWVTRTPYPEASGLSGNDMRTCIEGGSFETWAEALAAACEGAALDAEYGDRETPVYIPTNHLNGA
jgi:hypothetical protein